MTSPPTTPEQLERALSRLRVFAPVNLNEESDIPALTAVVAQSSIDNPGPTLFANFTATFDWCGGSQATVDCSELIGLVQAFTTNHAYLRKVKLTIPFQPGDTLRMIKNIWPAGCIKSNKSVHLKSPPASVANDLKAKEVLDILWEVCSWNLRLEGLTFEMNFYPDPGFLEKVAPCLPDMGVKHLHFSFLLESPPTSNDNLRGQGYTNKLKAAFSKLRDGLEDNVWLEGFQISTSDASLKATMEDLVTSNFSTLLRLNRAGRGGVIDLPQHRDTWLEVVSQYKLDGVYYYLRRNPWMFDHQKESNNILLQREIELKNREIEELREQVERQKAELEEKDGIIQRLTAGGV